MNIALIGYGKMGKAVENIAIARNHKIALTIDLNNAHEFTDANLQKADVAIEFTTPATAAANLKRCIDARVPVVCGTTGWLDQWDIIRQYCTDKCGGLFYASNYSIGVNLFFEINRYLAKLIAPYYGDYAASIQEIHHTEKKDAPSGTAITLANDIIDKVAVLERWINTPSGDSGELPIESLRQGAVAGTHTVKYDSDADEITICHRAKNRTGFALGAVLAAEFMCGKTGVYGMQDLLQIAAV
jgi:4-hydroxy-tetrahydrodipicolinate reductase